jgi:hypothetical protein
MKLLLMRLYQLCVENVLAATEFIDAALSFPSLAAKQ